MIKFINKFRKEEEGAVTVDWVVLTAAVVGLGIGAISLIQSNTESLADNIGESIKGGSASGDVSNYTSGSGS